MELGQYVSELIWNYHSYLQPILVSEQDLTGVTKIILHVVRAPFVKSQKEDA